MKDTINIYYLEIDENLTWDNISCMTKYISVKRRKHIEKLRYERDKISSLMTGLMARNIISRNTGIKKELLSFKANRFGKPYLNNITDYEFSVSHTHKKIIFADCNTRIGIDIEDLYQNVKEFENISKNNFTENEVMYILSSDNPNKEFIKVWTAKEAYVKMLGTGLATPLSSFDVIKGVNGCSIITVEHDCMAISVCCSDIYKSLKINPVTTNEIKEKYKK